MRNQASVDEPHAGNDNAADPPPLGDAVTEAFKASRRHLAELLELVTLEIRYSGLMLASVAALAVITALAAFSVWGLLVAAAVAGLIALGWGWTMALLIVAAANGLLAGLAVWLLRRALSRVGIDSTRHALSLGVSDAE